MGLYLCRLLGGIPEAAEGGNPDRSEERTEQKDAGTERTEQKDAGTETDQSDIEINLLTGSNRVIGFGSSTKVSARVKYDSQEIDSITVNWQKVENNVPVSLNLNTVKYSGSSIKLPTPELVINDAEQEDAGVYQLNVVSRTSTVTSEPVIVELHGDPVESISKEERHFLRFSLLCQNLGSKAVLLYFNKHVPETTLTSHLNTHRRDLHYKTGNRVWKCNREQFNILFPGPPAVAKASDFDINLIYKLIRNTIHVKPPTQGWGNSPLPGDVSEEDDIERVRYYRNKLAHNTDFKIQDDVFKAMWDDLSEALERLGGNQIKSDIDCLKTKTMDNKTKHQVIENIKNLKQDVQEEIQKLRERLDNPIPSHIQEQFNRRVSEWGTEDEMFVPTQSAEEVMIKIKEHNFVVMTGNSGTGKTFTVRHTALMMEKEGYIIVPAVKPEDISKYFKHGCKTVFVFDDLCGRFTLDDNVLSQWKSHKQSLETILKDDCCKVLASCRLQVFKENRMTSFCSEIDVNECKINCSLNDKCLLIEQYFGNKPETITEEKLSKCDFLPFLCSNIKNKNKGIPELEKCINDPFDFYSDEFKKLYIENDDGKRKCCALILCVLYNNTLTWDELSKQPDAFRSVLTNCELSSSESEFKINSVIKSLFGVYITNDNGTYKIIHDKLFDFVAKYFGEKKTHLFIKFADSNFLRERFSIKGRQKSETNDCIELFDDKIIKRFMKRMVRDWMKGEVNNVFGNTNMKSEQFRQELLSFLRQLELTSQRELVHIRENNSGDTPLLKICVYGDLEFAKWILDLGADINLGNNSKFTPLKIACFEGHTNLVKVLLKYESIKPNQSDKYSWSALHLACKKGNAEIVTELVQRNVDINSTIKGGYRKGFTPLMLACTYNNLEVVKVLLQCEQIDVHQSADDGTTALHLACETGNVEIVTELIQHNVDINTTIKGGLHKGWTPLMFALYESNLEVVNVLLQCEQIDVHQSADDGTTALQLACVSGNVEIVTELIQHNVDINTTIKGGCRKGWTPLMLACTNNHLEVVKVLLQCEQIDVNQSADDGTTALHVACMKRNVDIVTDLIQRGMDINQKKGNDWTPFMYAINPYNLEVVKELLHCKQIDVNQSADDGNTALHLACQIGNVEIVTDLIQRGMDINQKKGNGWTPLMLACTYNHLEVVKVLLQCEQIDVNQSADDGNTALHLACQIGNVEIVIDLIQRGMDINQKKGDDRTPLMLAIQSAHVGVVEVLLNCDQINVNHSDNCGFTALYFACLWGNINIVKLLIEHNADVNRGVGEIPPQALGNCVEHYAYDFKEYLNSQSTDLNQEKKKKPSTIYVCQTIHTKIVRVLAKFPQKVIKCKNDGFNPLIGACFAQKISIVEELLKCPDIKINCCTSYGQTALYWACLMGHVNVITVLLKHRADVNISDIIGISPLHIACWARNKKAVRLLIDHGADKTLQDNDSKTPVDIAVEENDQECLTILNQS